MKISENQGQLTEFNENHLKALKYKTSSLFIGKSSKSRQNVSDPPFPIATRGARPSGGALTIAKMLRIVDPQALRLPCGRNS